MDIKFFLYFVLPIILGVIIALTGAILLFVDSRKKPKAGEVDIEDWEMTGGKIISAQLSESQSDNTYQPMIEYVYTVNGVEYHGNKIFSGKNEGAKKDAAQATLDKHPVNMYVPVRYDPKNPSDSALEARPHPTSFIAIAGWTLAGFGFISCCFTAFMTFVIFGATQ